MSETVASLDGLAIGVSLVEVSDLDTSQIRAWVTSLNESMSSLNELHTLLKEMARDHQG